MDRSTLPNPKSLATHVESRIAAAQAEKVLLRYEQRLLIRRDDALNEFLEGCSEVKDLLLAPKRKRFDLDRPAGAFRRAAISVLEGAPAAGLTLAEFEQQVEVRYGGSVHARTPAMTLNRLRREGAAVRVDGRWRLTAPVS